jgi:Ankyrin repeat
MRNWIALYEFDSDVSREPAPESPGSPLYYAVPTGLKNLVDTLIDFHEGTNRQAEARDGNKLEYSDTDDGSASPQYMSKDTYVNPTGGILHTPLQAASWFGMIDILELLIKHGADPNAYGGCESGSALSAAAHSGYLDIMELLLDIGADLYEGILLETSDSSKESNMRNSDAKNDPEQEGEAIDENVEQELGTSSKRTEKFAEYEKKHEDETKPPVDAPECPSKLHPLVTLRWSTSCSTAGQ